MKKPKPKAEAPAKPSLAPKEKLFLKLLRQMEELQEPYSLHTVAKLAGWKSADEAWLARDALVRKGYLQDGTRLAVIECPVITDAGLAAMSAA